VSLNKKFSSELTSSSSVLQCVAVCCSVLYCSTLHSVAMQLQYTACRRVLQFVAMCCTVLQDIVVCRGVVQHAVVCCSVLQCVAVCCRVLQCAAAH